MRPTKGISIIIILGYLVFITVSWIAGYSPGQEISRNLGSFALDLLKVLPGAFILIGLFEVWVRRETVEHHLGPESGVRGYIWAVLLAGTTVGGLYVALPVAYSLFRKGAKLSVIFTYIGAAAICRVPMTVFEASFLGGKFTAIRLLVSLPLVIITSILLGNYLTKRHYRIEGPPST